MKDLIIITDKPITRESCSNLLIESFKGYSLLANDDETLYMKKSQKGFELWFSPEDILDDPIHLMGDTVDKCPNKKAFLTSVKYTSYFIASKIVEVLKPLYGRMWVEMNEKDEWFGTADEFLKLDKR